MNIFSDNIILNEILKIMLPIIRVFLPYILIIGSFYLLVMFYRILKKRKQKQKLRKSGIYNIDRFDGKTFEEYLNVIFKARGYKVNQTSYTKDYGADLIVSKDNLKYVVQAKRYNSKVGIKAVQEAVASIRHYGCEKAIVVTNSFYTKSAIELAKSNDVELWNRYDLINKLIDSEANKQVKKGV